MGKKKQSSEDAYAPAADSAREDMYRDLSGSQPCFRITKEEAPIGIQNFFPDYRYRFDGLTTTSGDSFISEFQSFVAANDYLVLDDAVNKDYADGFAKAAALAALFMDSLELQHQEGD